jgi:SET domain-containing protein
MNVVPANRLAACGTLYLIFRNVESPVLTCFPETLAPIMRDSQKRRRTTRLPRLFVARSKIHGLGLFAGEDIEWGRRVAEFEGQPLSIKEVKRRQRFYDSIGFTCLMEFTDGRGIDGVVGGNESRFINHSTVANVGALREGEWGIVFYSLDHIAEGEELTFNYGFDPKRIHSESPRSALTRATSRRVRDIASTRPKG